MKMWTIILAAVVSAAPADAADAPAAVNTLSATGQGNWEIICHIVRPGGESLNRILDAGHDHYSDANLLRASCDVKNANRAPLIVSISAPALKCPFKVAETGACEQSFAKGRAGSFELSAGTRR
ncbi:hypothetical protein U1839_15285 [Sphingomonas sp. RT2P30]|uniref:hypothetical protein n=1 Tax=Parasphingomonas halimpatiens TaxID=3096162 RepID=UPI002FC8382A